MTTLCACNCGSEIPPKDLFRYRPPFYLRGHGAPSLCQCGCGQTIPWKPHHRYKTPQKLPGHITPAERAGQEARRIVPRRDYEGDGLCECRCGQPTTIAPRTSRDAGTIKGHPQRFISGHNSSGMKRGPGRFTTNGYVFLHLGGNRYKGEHRLVMEEALDRPLKRHEHVHQINHDRSDNRPENLQLVNWAEHGRLHGRPKGVPVTEEQRAKYSASQKKVWAERKRQQSESP